MHNGQFKAKTKDTIDYVLQWVVWRQFNFGLKTFKNLCHNRLSISRLNFIISLIAQGLIHSKYLKYQY